jgi:hypothetical protein
MSRQADLLGRLQAIGESVARWPGALALLGLGSSGLALARLDDYSDLDFFVIVESGQKGAFLADLSWLSDIAAVAYAFMNTADGYKMLFADGIFCEFAVFEPAELATIPFTAGRIVWQAPGFDAATLQPVTARPVARDVAWLVGEILTNLYVGLGRARRGEVLSATRLIQGFAVDRLLELAPYLERPAPIEADPFAGERRFEQRFPALARRFSDLLPGYGRNNEAAAAMLALLRGHFSLDPALVAAIEAYLGGV